MAAEPTRCQCPGAPTMARNGACTTCGVEGPDHQRALQEALAARNPRPLMAQARESGRSEGYRQGLQAGRLQAVEALAERELRPFEHEMEIA
jgi:hypothetical protein